MTVGRIVRAIGGFFYVEPLEGNEAPLACSARGKLKIGSEMVWVGDLVEFSREHQNGVITGILPRKNVLKRPYIANVDLIILVFAHKNPNPHDFLIAKFLVLAEASGIPYLMVFNKADLVNPEITEELVDSYRSLKYQVLSTSVAEKRGQAELQEALAGKVAVFAGPSGVGKSALLNMAAPGFQLQTGAVSQKIGRGKHTTREVQLLKVDTSGYVADTPGFTQISLDFLEPQQLADCFPEFSEYARECKFPSCCHDTEPDCGVKRALAEGKIQSKRYANYLQLLAEVKENYKKRYR